MRILRVIASVDIRKGGPINGLISTTACLLEKGHQVEILTLDDKNDNHLKSFPFKLHCFNGVKFGYRYSIDAKKWLKKNIKNYDIVVIHGIWQFHSYATSKACVENNVPYVIFTHGMLDPWFNQNYFFKKIKKKVYWRLFESDVIRKAKNVLFTSDMEMVLSSKSFKPYSANGKVVSYGSKKPDSNKIDATNFFFSKFPELKNSDFLLFMSRIHPKKGLDLVIGSLPSLLNKYPDKKIVIAGPDYGNETEKLTRLSKQLGVDSQILWTGMLDGELKWGALYSCAALILISHQENFGIVVSEALSTETPVIISNKVNIFDQVEDYNAGLVCGDNIEETTNVLNRWFNLLPKERAILSSNAMRLYQDKFSIEAASASLEKVLERAVN